MGPVYSLLQMKPWDPGVGSSGPCTRPGDLLLRGEVRGKLLPGPIPVCFDRSNAFFWGSFGTVRQWGQVWEGLYSLDFSVRNPNCTQKAML